MNIDRFNKAVTKIIHSLSFFYNENQQPALLNANCKGFILISY